ncbi:hypothetical protein TVAG_496100 [Trichomonas vaginalis G3]|uniref:Uncharacterized protein n=1 Tax=Trichomonas vaginalis (strain ATCC PRA-98 / G3) TaxID=412133 RepID=A2DVP9_TRIV3|nr:hypothetical protein TVAGG3_0276270 [Trichomonas vaginalis G3]EAY15591.1 hypothetical protein TVAG_496100 [Trichomonas vaginalis G3]KAI5526237.1 hypothetical protein TVAGG3_0276270 [Trichomonas vaginalis G3]|eukprot:XP_001327814.1 hypothetical protein [Trichomonas vaginalis G3]
MNVLSEAQLKELYISTFNPDKKDTLKVADVIKKFTNASFSELQLVFSILSRYVEVQPELANLMVKDLNNLASYGVHPKLTESVALFYVSLSKANPTVASRFNVSLILNKFQNLDKIVSKLFLDQLYKTEKNIKSVYNEESLQIILNIIVTSSDEAVRFKAKKLFSCTLGHSSEKTCDSTLKLLFSIMKTKPDFLIFFSAQLYLITEKYPSLSKEFDANAPILVDCLRQNFNPKYQEIVDRYSERSYKLHENPAVYKELLKVGYKSNKFIDEMLLDKYNLVPTQNMQPNIQQNTIQQPFKATPQQNSNQNAVIISPAFTMQNAAIQAQALNGSAQTFNNNQQNQVVSNLQNIPKQISQQQAPTPQPTPQKAPGAPSKQQAQVSTPQNINKSNPLQKQPNTPQTPLQSPAKKNSFPSSQAMAAPSPPNLKSKSNQSPITSSQKQASQDEPIFIGSSSDDDEGPIPPDEIANELAKFAKMDSKTFLDKCNECVNLMKRIPKQTQYEKAIKTHAKQISDKVVNLYYFISKNPKDCDIYNEEDIHKTFKMQVVVDSTSYDFQFHYNDTFLWISFLINLQTNQELKEMASKLNSDSKLRYAAFCLFANGGGSEKYQRYQYKYNSNVYNEMTSIISASAQMMKHKKYPEAGLAFRAEPIVFNQDVYFKFADSFSMNDKLAAKVQNLLGTLKLSKKLIKPEKPVDIDMDRFNEWIVKSEQLTELDYSPAAKFVLEERLFPLDLRYKIARNLASSMTRFTCNLEPLKLEFDSSNILEKCFENYPVILYSSNTQFIYNGKQLTNREFMIELSSRFRATQTEISPDKSFKMGLIIAMCFVLNSKHVLKLNKEFFKKMKNDSSSLLITSSFKRGLTTAIPYNVYQTFSCKDIMQLFQINIP